MKKIYIAGPDVFEQDSVEIGKRYVDLCFDYGFKGVYPLDNKVNFNQPKQNIAKEIFVANIKLLHQADIVIANLNSFRGKEADSGTVWECGYAYALNKKVYGYMNNRTHYLDQFENTEKTILNGKYVDMDNRDIEDFDYPINLMIACSVENIVTGGFEDVLRVLVNSNTNIMN